tara:strand:- start:149 stop:784 length:636 start_codon:yes stop_codon:yes gene_type:complete
MRDQDFFSHRSPTTGLHSARLAQAGYRASTSAENLALNVSLQEAQSGLMHSLGHRLNILSTRVSHVGVGVVGEELEDGQRRWWVTQLFAKPVVRIDTAEAESKIVSAINRARTQAGQNPLKRSRPISRIAASVIDGERRDLNTLTQRVLNQVRTQGLLRSKTRAWAASVPDFEALQLPGFARADRVQSVGLSVRQAEDSTGAITVLLVFSQ